jgi:hypothetical protein
MSELLGLVDAESLRHLLVIFVLLVLAAWCGKTLSRRYARASTAQDEDIKIVLGATLSLFGLLLGFLLSFAISGYNTRISSEEHEAIAVANAFQRTSLLVSSDAQEQAKTILEKYLAARILFYKSPDDVAREEARMQALHLQIKMWNFVSEEAKQTPSPLSMSLVDACNQLYITQQKTMASWRNQIPLAAWLILVVFGVCSNFLIGYQMHSSDRGLAWLLVVPFVIAMALFMISEIDMPGLGVIHVTPENLEGLRGVVALQRLPIKASADVFSFW